MKYATFSGKSTAYTGTPVIFRFNHNLAFLISKLNHHGTKAQRKNMSFKKKPEAKIQNSEKDFFILTPDFCILTSCFSVFVVKIDI